MIPAAATPRLPVAQAGLPITPAGPGEGLFAGLLAPDAPAAARPTARQRGREAPELDPSPGEGLPLLGLGAAAAPPDAAPMPVAMPAAGAALPPGQPGAAAPIAQEAAAAGPGPLDPLPPGQEVRLPGRVEASLPAGATAGAAAADPAAPGRAAPIMPPLQPGAGVPMPPAATSLALPQSPGATPPASQPSPLLSPVALSPVALSPVALSPVALSPVALSPAVATTTGKGTAARRPGEPVARLPGLMSGPTSGTAMAAADSPEAVQRALPPTLPPSGMGLEGRTHPEWSSPDPEATLGAPGNNRAADLLEGADALSPPEAQPTGPVQEIRLRAATDAALSLTLRVRTESDQALVAAGTDRLAAELAGIGARVEAIRVELPPSHREDGPASNAAAGQSPGGSGGGDSGRRADRDAAAGRAPSAGATGGDGAARSATRGKVDRYA